MQQRGLTFTEALARLKQFGYNELPNEQRKTILQVAISVLREPMIALLLLSAIIYFFLGDHTESVLLLASAMLVIGINVYQDVRSERALEALKSLTSPRALVLRNGELIRIAARDLVPGDVITVSEGDRIAADAEILEQASLLVDESLITGESLPVEKNQLGNSEAAQRESSHLFSGSLVVRGSGVAEIKATGPHTEIGKIGHALATIEESKTPLQVQTAKLVKTFAIVGLICCVLAIILFRMTRGGWTEATLAGIALAMSLLPEEFPVILSIFLTLGARRLSTKGILIRRMPAVEALGTVTVLAVDKTGTLTRNEMALIEIATTDGTEFKLSGSHRINSGNRTPMDELLHVAALASRAHTYDPMDKAVHQAIGSTGEPDGEFTLVREYPLSAELPAVMNVWKVSDRNLIAVKGAPEAVLDLCRMNSSQGVTVHSQVTRMAERGLRVLAVASASSVEVYEDLRQYVFTYHGLLAFADPLREGIREAVQECYKAGVRTVMITGDYPVTARTIAREAGLHNPDEVLTGRMIEAMTEPELLDRLHTTNVFARVTPNQKLELVRLLKQSGEIVAMTGDGVNDAPALKMAHIGVAMGGRGTDVAREASAVVLTSDDFPSLVTAVRLGRKTYDNIKKAMYYVFAIHFPIAGLSLLPLLLGMPLILMSIHIVLLELIIDPISSIVFEAEPAEDTVMNRPPRDPSVPIFQRRNLLFAALQGISVFLVCAFVYLYSYDRTNSEYEARTLCFATLILANLGLALVNRSWSHTFLQTLRIPNPSMWWSMTAGIVTLIIITTVPQVSHLFHFGPFHFHDWIICGIAAAFSLTWFEILKLLSRGKLTV